MSGTTFRLAWAAGQRVLMLLSVVVLTLGVTGLGAGRSARAEKVPLRQVDWLAVVQFDPNIALDTSAYPLPGGNWPFIETPVTDAPDETLSGYAMVDAVVYGDLDGDGAEEAVVPVDSGGTGGMLGFLLFREADPAPKLVLVKSGYKLGVSVEENQLAISEPHYVGFEANCCPSATVRTLNTLQGDRLVTLTTETTPNDVQEPTVWSFYAAVGDRRYDEAYEFLSPAQQASNPFDRWKAGYANTQSIEVETAPGSTPNEVRIVLTSVDSRPGGGTVTQRFAGTWTLIWSAEQKRWLLDKPSIRAA